MGSASSRRTLILLVGMALFQTAAVVEAGQPSTPAREVQLAHQETVEDFGALIPQRDPEAGAPAPGLERVSTVVPWPRGLAMVDGDLVALARGRHRSQGGVPQDFDDQAGLLFRIDTSIAEPVVPGELAGDAVRRNGEVLAKPTSPPFFPHRVGSAPEDNKQMTRPYCGLAYDAASRNLFVCCYAGAELQTGFRKHATDSLLRYDLRTERLHVVEQHDHSVVPESALGSVISNEYYPHHDPANAAAPHGWLNGIDGCTVVGDYLYAAAKDNHLIGQYDLRTIRENPDAPPPPSRVVLGPNITLRYPGGEKAAEVLGACTVAAYGDWLYIGYRTSSVVIRVPLTPEGDVVRDAPAELIAVFEPWDREKKRSGDMFDMAFSPDGELFVSMAREGRVWRVGKPDPQNPFYGNDQSQRRTTAPPFLDMSKLLGKRASCGNILVDADGWLYVCTRSNDLGEGDLHGTIYRASTR